MYPRSGFLVAGNIRQNHPFVNFLRILWFFLLGRDCGLVNNCSAAAGRALNWTGRALKQLLVVLQRIFHLISPEHLAQTANELRSWDRAFWEDDSSDQARHSVCQFTGQVLEARELATEE